MNRNESGRRITAIVGDIACGAFKEFHPHGPCLGYDGRIMDGRNRFLAIENAGRHVGLCVCIDVPYEMAPYFDRPRVRSITQQMRLDPECDALSPSDTKTGIIRWLTSGDYNQAPSYPEAKARLMQFQDAIQFTLNSLQGKRIPGVTICPVLAAIVKAYVALPAEKLPRLYHFGETLVGLPSTADDHAATVLKEWLLRIKADRKKGASSLDIHLRTQVAIEAYVERRPIQRLYPVKRERFPLSD